MKFIDLIKRSRTVFTTYRKRSNYSYWGHNRKSIFFYNSPLLSRCQVIKLEKLCKEDLNLIKLKAEKFLGFNLPISNAACEILFDMVDGDARYFLNLVEEISSLDYKQKKLEPKDLKKLFNKKFSEYDKNNDQHYNLISALHKSLRASDTDAHSIGLHE